MAKEKFREWNPKGSITVRYTDAHGAERTWTANQVELLNSIQRIVEEFQRQNIRLTNRQTYYQLVAGNTIPNADKVYKRICTFLTDARYGGHIDWDAIEDRGREAHRHSEWENVKDFMGDVVDAFRLQRWSDQDEYIELYCFEKSTPIITKTGVKNIIDVNIGDEVLTHNNRFKKVTKTISHNYKGAIYSIKPHYIPDFTCSENHPFLAVKTHKCKYHNKNCKSTCYRAKQCGTAYYKNYKTEWIEAKDLKNGDFLLIPRYKTINDTQSVTIAGKIVPLNSDFLKVAGLYVAEGSIEPDGRTLKYTFHLNEIDYANYVKGWFNKTFPFVTVSFFENLKQNTRRVNIYSKTICEFFKIFGVGASNKRLPDYFIELPVDKQKQLIEAMIDGDGIRLKNGKKYSTVSKTLLYQTKIILDRMGIIAGISVDKKEKNVLAKNDCYTLNMFGRKYNIGIVTEDYIYIPIDRMKKSDFDGDLYNLTVDGDNSYSIGVISHNCEKQALESVLSPLAERYHIHFGYNKGYSSATMMYELSKRVVDQIYDGKTVTVLYCGDHDPSGLDMVRDIQERINEFLMSGNDAFELEETEEKFHIAPLALNAEQIHQYNPPPNPAKISDPRARWYIEEYGNSSWELDALRPEVLRDIVERGIQSHMDIDKYNAWIRREKPLKQRLQDFADSLVNGEEGTEGSE